MTWGGLDVLEFDLDLLHLDLGQLDLDLLHFELDHLQLHPDLQDLDHLDHVPRHLRQQHARHSCLVLVVMFYLLLQSLYPLADKGTEVDVAYVGGVRVTLRNL